MRNLDDVVSEIRALISEREKEADEEKRDYLNEKLKRLDDEYVLVSKWTNRIKKDDLDDDVPQMYVPL